MKFNLNDKRATLKSAIYDLGFILSYITAQIYHYFEYFKNQYIEYIVFIFLVLITLIGFELKLNIKNVNPKKITKTLFKINLIFILFLLILLGSILSIWPYGANHTNFNTFLIFVLLTVYGLNFYDTKSLNLNLLKNHKFLLYSLVILYLSAGLHKMNFDFYDPEKSCANWYHIKLFKRFFETAHIENLPYFIKYISPKIVGLIEILSPLLLLFKSTRLVGVYLLIFIHSYLGLGGFSDFSSLAFCILFLYFPIAFKNNTLWIKKISLHFLSSYLIFGICLISYFFYNDQKEKLQTLQGLILIFSVFNILNFKNSKKNNFQFDKKIYKLKDSFVFIPISILFLFSISTYFGYRSGGNFNMFSNLKFVGHFNNHLFMKKFDLFKYETEVFKVLKSSDETIFAEVLEQGDWITKSGLDLAYSKIIKMNIQNSFFILIKTKNNQLISLNPENIRSFLGPQKNWLFYKTYMYSFLPDDSPENVCRW